MERAEPGYENMDHFVVNFGRAEQMLQRINFQSGNKEALQICINQKVQMLEI